MDMYGKTTLVTGSTGGIGKETARGLARLGARVLLVGRDPDRAAAAATEIVRDTGNPEVASLTADLLVQENVRDLARRVADRCDRLDVLVNNLGVLDPRLGPTADGIEPTFAAHVVTPYALTVLLLPQLKAAGGRVVNVTGGIPGGRIDLGNLQGEKRRIGWTFSQYNHSKTALMAMSYEMSARLSDAGVTVNVVYPGHGYTPGNQALPMASFPRLYRPVVPVLRLLGPRLLSDLEKSARSTLSVATAPDFKDVTGVYVDSKGNRQQWPAAILDAANRAAIWSQCEDVSKLTLR